MEEENTEKSLVEKREELMVSSSSSSSSNSTIINLRMANFLNPTYSSTSRFPILKNPKLLSSSLPPPTSSDTKTKPVEVSLRGWRNLSKEWGSWVLCLESLYGSVWKMAGIYDAIISSTFKFQRDNNLIISLAEKWCLETNTFVFPWGEATITLQDMMVLGGFSVFGSPVFSSSSHSKEMKLIEHQLEAAKGEFSSRKAWIRRFMCSGSDIEHEAFLLLWLEMFVFNDSGTKFQARIFSVAVHLAKGKVYALAPAVLASIYRDLGLLKTIIVAANENSAHKLPITLYCPLHLVQLWAWERFPAFQPLANAIDNGDHPRSALWKNLKVERFKCVRSDLDLAARKFQWQPYLHGLHIHKLYKKSEQSKHLGSDRDSLALGLCLRVSELVGLDCVQQYLPHRVARQFGLDQDIPSGIARTDVLPDVAWSNYIRPFSDIEVFVPSHFSKPDVTVRYLEWWNQTGIDSPDRLEDHPIFNPIRRKRSSMERLKRIRQALIGEPIKSIIQADATMELVENITRSAAIGTQLNEADATMELVESITQTAAIGTQLNEADAKMELVESITQTATIGTQLNALEEESDTIGRIPSNIAENTNLVNTDDYSTEIPGLVLEARIARNEEVVAS